MMMNQRPLRAKRTNFWIVLTIFVILMSGTLYVTYYFTSDRNSSRLPATELEQEAAQETFIRDESALFSDQPEAEVPEVLSEYPAEVRATEAPCAYDENPRCRFESDSSFSSDSDRSNSSSGSSSSSSSTAYPRAISPINEAYPEEAQLSDAESSGSISDVSQNSAGFEVVQRQTVDVPVSTESVREAAEEDPSEEVDYTMLGYASDESHCDY